MTHALELPGHGAEGAQLQHPADSIISVEPLGAIYSPESTNFFVWAPTANRVCLRVYESPTGGKPRILNMTRRKDGTWAQTLIGDWKGIYYTYTAEGQDSRFDPSHEVIDPYARAVTAHDGRGIVVFDDTPVSDSPRFPMSRAIIYEMHIRDFTIDPDSGIQRRGKYLGLAETGTNLTGRPDIATGLDHLRDLGVNVVQLMPILEFQNDEANDRYGWGYDSVHFNSPDGWYATERFDARRVTEVKKLVDALHRSGLKVTLDVVFNHTVESLGKHHIYSFEGLVPGYYYRLKRDGSYWNGSGVGNEFRTEAPMARRFIIDSLKYWVTEYKVDGFRFDLLGLIDALTLEEAVHELRAIKPEILVYGEPWAGGSTPIELTGKGVQKGKGWAVFNDHFRDALKGNVFDARATGFVQSGNYVQNVKLGIRGSIDDFSASPIESINYVQCHDNHTLWDRIVISTSDMSSVTNVDRRAMDRLAAAVLLTSQGIPFIEAGQEFLRSRDGDHNSFDKPDSVNMIRWEKKAENLDIYEYYRGLIELRKTHPMLSLSTADGVRSSIKFLDDDLGFEMPSGCIGFQVEDITGSDTWSRALVLFNSQPRSKEIRIPQGEWLVYADYKRADSFPLRRPGFDVLSGTVVIAARSALVLGEERRIAARV